MPDERQRRRFDDISHLFISRQTDKPPAVAESYIWIAALGPPCLRAYLASGLASAISSLRVNVTLLEIGRSLPNAGYYFGLDPCVYLSGSVQGGAGFDFTVGASLRVASAKDRRGLPRFSADDIPDGLPRVVITAFDASEGADSIETGGLWTGCRGYSAGGSSCPERKAVMVIFRGDGGGDLALRINRAFLSAHSDAGVLVSSGRDPSGRAGFEDKEDADIFELPRDLFAGLARRAAPSHPFFSGLSSKILQLAVSNRRRRESHAAF